jgi:uncharacterized membrane protein
MRHKQVVYVVFSIMIVCTLLILCVSMANAAVISGTIYDLALQKESDIVVEIDTMPQQLIVSKDGYYAFNVKPGNYTLHAYTALSESMESITVTDDGEYVLDIVLEDKVLETLEDISLTDSGIDVSSSVPNGDGTLLKHKLLWILAGSIILLAIILLMLYLLIYRRRHKHLKHVDNKSIPKREAAELVDEYEHKILNIIKKEKRTTQKDVRKEVPLSEAKISLILTDLEDKGKIRKIRKGRGNVLIFVKD